MMKKNKKYKLLLVVILSLIFFSATNMARASYKANSKIKDAARVAKFDVLITHADSWSDGEYNDVTTHGLADNKEYIFAVKNNSEVSIKARAVIESGIATVSPSGFINLSAGENKNISITVTGDVDGRNVKFHFEYEQVD